MLQPTNFTIAAVIPEPKLHGSYGAEELSINEDMREKGLFEVGAAITNDKRSNRTVYLAYFFRTADGSGQSVAATP